MNLQTIGDLDEPSPPVVEGSAEFLGCEEAAVYLVMRWKVISSTNLIPPKD